jgi:hypothetical protein
MTTCAIEATGSIAMASNAANAIFFKGFISLNGWGIQE